jgi:hypothetical protein
VLIVPINRTALEQAIQENFAAPASPARRLFMTIRTDLQRLSVLGLAAILSCFVGCSMFKDQTTPKLAAEVTPGPAPDAPPPAKYVIEVREEKEKPKVVEKTLAEPIHIQTALEQSGAIKKFERCDIEVYRPLPAGGWHKMKLEFDRDSKRIPPEYDYAILPGDRIIVTEDTTTIIDDITERALRPLGITPPKKKDPFKERYEIRG